MSELIDTEVYHWWWRTRESFPQWTRMAVSNAISLPIDSLIFASLAFLILPPLFGGEALPLAAIPAIIAGQILFKAIVTVVSMPMIYLVNEQPLRLVVASAD